MRDKPLSATISDRGNWAFTATVLAAYVPLIFTLDWANNFWSSATLILLGLVYIAVGTLGIDHLPHRDHKWPLWTAGLYFLIQLALASSILYLSQGLYLTVIIVLPLAAHTVVLLPKWGVVVVCGMIMAVMLVLFTNFANFIIATQVTLSMGAGMLFVIVFSQLANSEQHARQEVEHLAAELTDANQKLREYAAQIEELATTRERNRIAREIHDGLGHYLTVINVQIQAARAVQTSDPGKAIEAMGKAGAMTQEALADIRRSVASLRAAATDSKPLAESLTNLVEETKASGLQTTLTILGNARPLSPQTELTLYRATQEALTNVQKHAHASAVQVTLDYTDPAQVKLSVQDNGLGATQTEGGFGLLGVRERTQLLNGRVTMGAANGSGFVLTVELPSQSNT
jgi:signal transduction histidine kinase